MERKIIFGNGIAVGENHKCFVVAEIGQNHQGDINIAKKLIKTAKECGADCVKFQKTYLKAKFNRRALDRSYTNSNSWGKTYGEHKAYLEFSEEQFLELQRYSKELGILFTASAMDSESLTFLCNISVPFVKIGSGDSNNLPMIKQACLKNIPLVISTGMANFENVKLIYETVLKHHTKFALLHCVSSYPTPVEEVNLAVIKLYQDSFPGIVIGYSGHELGIDISIAAVVMGAKIIERHITLDRNLKGTDHSCSLEPQEFQKMVTNIRKIETAIGKPLKIMYPSEKTCYDKLGKTIVAAKCLPIGHVLKEADMLVKVAEPKGIDAANFYSIVGRKLKQDVNEDDSLLFDYLE